jgi:hypothetical protein
MRRLFPSQLQKRTGWSKSLTLVVCLHRLWRERFSLTSTKTMTRPFGFVSGFFALALSVSISAPGLTLRTADNSTEPRTASSADTFGSRQTMRCRPERSCLNSGRGLMARYFVRVEYVAQSLSRMRNGPTAQAFRIPVEGPACLGRHPCEISLNDFQQLFKSRLGRHQFLPHCDRETPPQQTCAITPSPK